MFTPVDVRKLAKAGRLEPGTRGNLVAYRGERVVHVMHFAVKENGTGVTISSEGRSTVAGLTWTPQHLGGRRIWFACPCCARRVAILYGSNSSGRIVCRTCWRAAYPCQRVSRRDRAVNRAMKSRRRLGECRSLGDPIPDKPTGMHWRTYERLAQAAEDDETRSEEIADEMLCGVVGRWLARGRAARAC